MEEKGLSKSRQKSTDPFKEYMEDVSFNDEKLPISEPLDFDSEDTENIDIQVVNQLATLKDNPSLPCFTLRVFVTGTVKYLNNKKQLKGFSREK